MCSDEVALKYALGVVRLTIKYVFSGDNAIPKGHFGTGKAGYTRTRERATLPDP